MKPGSNRAQRESEHFDSLAQEDRQYLGDDQHDYFSHPCIPENRCLLNLYEGKLAGLRVLDIGCGLGESSIAFALRGSQVTGIDVSSLSLQRAQAAARSVGAKVDFILVHDHKLPFDDESFDLVYGNGVLHHVDLQKTLPEIKRVLKPKGHGFFIEPTRGNPLIEIYRYLARKKRSIDEHPLTREQYTLIRSLYPQSQTIPFQVATLLVFFKMFIFERKNPNRVSYWREPILNKEKYARIYHLGSKIDEWLKVHAPRLFQLLCWNNVIILPKK